MGTFWNTGVDGRASKQEIESRPQIKFPVKLSKPDRELRNQYQRNAEQHKDNLIQIPKQTTSKSTLAEASGVKITLERTEAASCTGTHVMTAAEKIGDPNFLGPYHSDVDEENDGDISTQNFSRDENALRGNWTGRLDFILSCIGYAVGLGNVWRFPYLCYKNGGGIFFIPYVIMLIFVGMPVFFFELALAQFCSAGPVSCWKFAPFFSGIGLSMVLISCFVALYYNIIIALSIYYLFSSMTSELPWATCPVDRSSELCVLRVPKVDVVHCLSESYYVNTTDGFCYRNKTRVALWNQTAASILGIERKLAAEDYFNYVATGKAHSSGIDDLGKFNWKLALCLLLAWAFVVGTLARGVKSSGKVVYFTATFPYVVLVILLVKGAMLEGHLEGIQFYLSPKLEKLVEADVWKDAAVQIFFSLSASWGGLIALASYNRFHNDCLRDALITSSVNCLTSFFAGFVVFSFMGYLAKEMNVRIEDVASDGVGLAFYIYPEAMKTLEMSPLWSCLFFFMLLTLGLDSQFAYVETITTSLMDRWPKLRERKISTILTAAIPLYLLGLLMCTDGGTYILQFMDHFSGGWNVMLIAFFECVSISWVYGADRFRNDIKTMLGKHYCGCVPWKPWSKWWILCWRFFTPLGVLFIMVYSWVDYKPFKYEDYTYPAWAQAFGWLMLLSTILCMFIPGIFLLTQAEGTLKERFQQVLRPAVDWGPALVRHRRLIKHVEGFIIDPFDEMDEDNKLESELVCDLPENNDGIQILNEAKTNDAEIKVHTVKYMESTV